MALNTNSNQNQNIIRVKLIKQKKYGLGFLIRKRPKTSHVIVSDLIAGGMAAESGLVHIGDIILKVNDTSLEDKTYEDSVNLLKALPVNHPVALILKGPDGYTSHLETRFNYEGTPRTVRVTRPCVQEESFIDRLKKSLSLSVTSSPSLSKSYHTKQTQVSCECHEGRPLTGTTGLNGDVKTRGLNSAPVSGNNVRTRSYNNSTKDNGDMNKMQGVGKDDRMHFQDQSTVKTPDMNMKEDDITDLNNYMGGMSTPSISNSEIGFIGNVNNAVTNCRSSVSTETRPAGIETPGAMSPVTVFINDKEDTNFSLIEHETSIHEQVGNNGVSGEAIRSISRPDNTSRSENQVHQSQNGVLIPTGNSSNLSENSTNSPASTSSTAANQHRGGQSVNSDNNKGEPKFNFDEERRDTFDESIVKAPRLSYNNKKGVDSKKGNEKQHGVPTSQLPDKRSNSPGCNMDLNNSRRSSLYVGTGDGGSGSESRRGSMMSESGSSERRNSVFRKYVKLRNVGDERPVCTDTLHQKAIETVKCSTENCMGSLMDVGVIGNAPRPKEELFTHARDFIDQYYQSIKRYHSQAHLNRLEEVEKAIEDKGTYDLTTAELTYGAKTAWRNAPRCIGRIQWSKLQVFDARHITTARGMFEAICNHIKYATNKGNIRSALTVFPARTDGKHDYRVWNRQFIGYAGYKQEDGTVIGDPINVEFTDLCKKLGWKGKGTRFDILPLLLQANGHDPEMFDIPAELVLEVSLKHPKLPWFGEMGLKWYALPAVSSMAFDCGGLMFTGAPFNGWFMGTEIGARDLCDKYRYNLLEDIAKRMGFDTRKSSTLWKDRTLVEMNVAVLHSFQTQGVTITDHHAASESFMKHLDNEQKLRGGCPADWVWIVPPMSGGLLPVFHQEMLMYKLKPSFEYMNDPWKTHTWKKDKVRSNSTSDRPRRKIGFRELARAVKFSAKLMGKALARRVKCTILYATETGRSEAFAKTLCQIFKHSFDAKVISMLEYDVNELEHEALVLTVTSTFGNGDPPENGEDFAKRLFEIKHPESKDKLSKQTSYMRMTSSDREDDVGQSDVTLTEVDDNLTLTGPLSNVRYSVFGLGSSAYPNFCAFAHYVDNMFHDLGAERIFKIMEGDELCGQEESFRIWAKDVYKSACETFCLGDDNIDEGVLVGSDNSWKPDKFRLTPADGEKEMDIMESLSAVHNKTVLDARFVSRTQLQSADSDRQTILVKLDTTNNSSELQYHPGDHVAIFPENSSKLVNAILMRLHNTPSPEQVIKTEVLSERSTPMGTAKSWEKYGRIPTCTLKTAFSRFLDITTPPTQTLLKLFASQTTKDCDRESLENLANDPHLYEEWKHEKQPNIVQVMDEFPSLRIPPSLLLSQLPLLQSRFYSISSSLMSSPGEIHVTVAVVSFRTQGDTGTLHEGVCSTWLNRLEEGSTVPCLVRHAASFHMPEEKTKPIILVGPGTGIAPFRSFWHQRKIDKEMFQPPSYGNKNSWGDIVLYFGCRNSNIDDIYKEELKQMREEGVLKEVYTALSREPNQPKTYVQNILKQNSSEVFKTIVRESGHFYVCGDVKMANDVTATLEKILSIEGNMTSQDAKNFILKLRDSNRFHEDIFGVTLRSSEVTDRARDQAKKAWNFINAAGKIKTSIDKETVTPIPTDVGDIKVPKGKPRAPQKTMYNAEIKTE